MTDKQLTKFYRPPDMSVILFLELDELGKLMDRPMDKVIWTAGMPKKRQPKMWTK